MRWNIFDLLVVTLGVFDTLTTNSGKGAARDVTFMRSLRLLRIAKILRMVRVMRFFAELRVILNSVLGSLLSLFWAFVMLLLIYYVFGLLFVQGVIQTLADGTLPAAAESDVLRYYGSV